MIERYATRLLGIVARDQTQKVTAKRWYEPRDDKEYVVLMHDGLQKTLILEPHELTIPLDDFAEKYLMPAVQQMTNYEAPIGA